MICKHYPTILSYFIQVKTSSWFCLVYFASSLKTLGRYGYSLNSFFVFGSNIFSFLTASVYVFIFCWLVLLVGKVPKGTYLLSSLQSLPDSAEMGRDSVSEERISGSFRWQVFWSQWNGQAVFNSLLFNFWHHHPIIINVCPPKRYLSFFPQIILPCCFLSVDFPLFYFLSFGKTNHFIACFRFRLPNTMPKRPAD